jgi:two-component system cell cycle response regulator DivK
MVSPEFLRELYSGSALARERGLVLRLVTSSGVSSGVSRRRALSAVRPDRRAMNFGEYLGMSKLVLIVEDNELNMKLFNDLLEAHGYATVQTQDGMEALKIARERRPDLIVMDIQLPEVSGLEVTKWLKEDDSLRKIPVIAVTAFAMKGDEEKIREGGCEDYISKPISVTKFLETVQKYLN